MFSRCLGSFVPSLLCLFWFQWVRNLNPALLHLQETDLNVNTDPFVSRVSTSLSFFLRCCELHDNVTPDGNKAHLLAYEELQLDRMVTSLIACEGTERAMRPESKEQWVQRLLRLDFAPLPATDVQLSKLTRALAHFPPGLALAVDDFGVQMTWRGQPLVFGSSWVPRSGAAGGLQ